MPPEAPPRNSGPLVWLFGLLAIGGAALLGLPRLQEQPAKTAEEAKPSANPAASKPLEVLTDYLRAKAEVPDKGASVRLDKWLWAARFYRTRALAVAAIEAGHVRVNGERAKPSREVAVGERIEVRTSSDRWTIGVRALANRRGPAAAARAV